MGVKKKPAWIKDVVLQVMGELADHRTSNGEDITEVFEKVFTEKERQHLKLSGIKEKVLFLHVDSPAWMFQFNLKRQKILQSFQREIPDIQKIFFKIGKTT